MRTYDSPIGSAYANLGGINFTPGQPFTTPFVNYPVGSPCIVPDQASRPSKDIHITRIYIPFYLYVAATPTPTESIVTISLVDAGKIIWTSDAQTIAISQSPTPDLGYGTGAVSEDLVNPVEVYRGNSPVLNASVAIGETSGGAYEVLTGPVGNTQEGNVWYQVK